MNIKPRTIPFQIGGPIQNPANFVGRTEILQAVSNAMLNLQNISLHGERRTGKTSLLLYLAHLESATAIGLPENHIPVYFNFQDFAKASAVNVWRAIAEATAENIKQKHPARQVESEKFLNTINDFLTASESPELFGTGFGRALALLDNAKLNIHFLFDEFDQTERNPNLGDSFYDTLRSLPTRAENISYVIATRTGLAALQPIYDKVSSPFFNIFTSITLTPFTEDEVYKLIFDYFAQAELDISLAEKLCDESDFLYDVTGYHPFFLQMLCYHLGARLDKDDWPRGQAQQKALQAFEQDSAPHFKFYWEVSSNAEIGLMKKLAIKQPVDWQQPETMVIENLKERCLVVQASEAKNNWRIFSASYSQWIKNKTVQAPLPAFDPRILEGLSVPGGVVKLYDKFYIEREVDTKLRSQIVKWGTTTTIRAPRQTGKTSLLMRGIHYARQQGIHVVFLDFQSFASNQLASLDIFLYELAMSICDELDLNEEAVEQVWQGSRSASKKIVRFMEKQVLLTFDKPIVLAMDEADSLLQTNFYQDFFGLLRSWHNRRAAHEVWEKLNMVLVISTEPYLLIDDINQSPFNVSLELNPIDFNEAQVRELNHRYDSPVTEGDLPHLMALLHGHPFLTRQALYMMVTEGLTWTDLSRFALSDQGPFGDHLRHQYRSIRNKPDLKKALLEIIDTNRCSDEAALFRLLQAGLVKGSGDVYTCRCDLYKSYFKNKLF